MFNQDNQSFRMRRVVGFAFVAVVGVLAVGGVVMFLWNAILPPVVHVEPLNYWQSVGLLILCRILFGGFGGRHRGGGKPPFAGKSAEWREKWMSMSSEERAQFKEQWKKRCQSRD